MRLSVVVPVLDEAERIGRQLAELGATVGIDEVVVVDGGSRDGTADVVRRAPGVRLITAPRGRGTQLNAGARAARGDVLLFLHADVTLPADAATCVGRRACRSRGGGGRLPRPDRRRRTRAGSGRCCDSPTCARA